MMLKLLVGQLCTAPVQRVSSVRFASWNPFNKGGTKADIYEVGLGSQWPGPAERAFVLNN